MNVNFYKLELGQKKLFWAKFVFEEGDGVDFTIIDRLDSLDGNFDNHITFTAFKPDNIVEGTMQFKVHKRQALPPDRNPERKTITVINGKFSSKYKR